MSEESNSNRAIEAAANGERRPFTCPKCSGILGIRDDVVIFSHIDIDTGVLYNLECECVNNNPTIYCIDCSEDVSSQFLIDHDVETKLNAALSEVCLTMRKIDA